ncbi:MAG: SprT-like domain-containing protein [Methylococcaceae bacterium]|nr:SprT-like domain-containing protein [Methylococcaceae bacterium]
MNSIQPLNRGQQNLVTARTAAFIHLAETIFNRHFDRIPVCFDLKGRSAGMYRVTRNQGQIRYNSFIFSKYFADNLAVTVPHEVAHYITDAVYGLRNIRPHGSEWKRLMAQFGADASRTCNYDLNGIPVRRTRRHVYVCGCSTHQLTSVRHNKIQRGTAHYFCRNCRRKLTEAG